MNALAVWVILSSGSAIEHTVPFVSPKGFGTYGDCELVMREIKAQLAAPDEKLSCYKVDIVHIIPDHQ
jgi:hypothetical protein